MHHHLDVLTVTDCRLPGGTASSTAEELNSQARLGLRSGLLHIDTPLVSRTRSLNPRLQRQLDLGHADLVLPTDEVECELVVIRNPKTALSLLERQTAVVQARRCVVVVNHVPVSDQRVHYTSAEVNLAVTRWLGVEPEWVPIGPLVRNAFVDAEPRQPLSEPDWVNVIDVDEWAAVHEPPEQRPARIGRHSRDDYVKFPASRDVLLRAYPESTDLEVRILGGVPQINAILGGPAPQNWTLLPFGSVEAHRFLSSIDIYGYFHHPELVEAFGRNMLEALASGLPVVTHRHFAALFGDAITICEPDQAMQAYRQLASDPALYREMGQRGQDAARQLFGYERHAERLSELLSRSLSVSTAVDSSDRQPAASGIAGVSQAVDTASSDRPDRRRRVLFISPNGAGLGHLTRLMAVARRASEHIDATLLTFSAAADIAADQGFDVHYVASRAVSGSGSVGWHLALAERLEALIDQTSPDAVMIDSTEPYRGLLHCLARHPEIPVVWLRRGMWRPGVTNPVLEHAGPFFDLIIEPGDVARAADTGATSSAQEVCQLGPVTYLRTSELLTREDARDHLGLQADEFAVLIQLGAGNINDTSSAVYGACSAVRDRNGARVFLSKSQIANAPILADFAITPLEMYPLSKVLRAFDMAVVAPGYNTCHEVIAAGVPTVFVPNMSTITDDQQARAQWIANADLGVMSLGEDASSVETAVKHLLDDDVRERINTQLAKVRWGDGGDEVVDALIRLIETAHSGQALRHARRQQSVGALEAAIAVRTQRRSRRKAGASVRRQSSGGPARFMLFRVRSLAKRATRHAKKILRQRFGYQRLAATYTLLPGFLQRVVARYAAVTTVLTHRENSLLRVPPGVILDEVDESSISRVLVVIDSASSNEDVVNAVAKLQATSRTFAPVFLTASLDAAAFRRFGYVWEHSPITGTKGATTVFDQRRLEQVIRWYRPDLVIEAACVSDISAPDSLFRAWLRSNDRTSAR